MSLNHGHGATFPNSHSGQLTDFARLGLDAATYAQFCRIMDSPPEGLDVTKLTPIKELLPPSVTWCVCACVRVCVYVLIRCASKLCAIDN